MTYLMPKHVVLMSQIKLVHCAYVFIPNLVSSFVI